MNKPPINEDTHRYKAEMLLHSDSGFCMPFEESKKDVEISLGYGEQIHPFTGKPFFHHGIDFNVSHYILAAVATGTVTSIFKNKIGENCLTIQYSDYEVLYDHLGTIFVYFGQKVKARQKVAMTTNLLHFEVKYKDEDVDPLEFLTMLYSNMKATEFEYNGGEQMFATPVLDVHNNYDRYEDEIEELMLRYMPDYMDAIEHGMYKVPDATIESLQSAFSPKNIKDYFFERLPSMANPLGFGNKSIPLIVRVQNILINDLLNYLNIFENIVLSSSVDYGDIEVKKKTMTH